MGITEIMIISIVLVGVLLVVVEIFFIPGTTVFGIIGGIVMIAGVYMAYSQVGTTFGHIMLSTAGLSSVALTIVGFKMVQDDKFSVVRNIDSKLETLKDLNIKVGDKGVTISYLRPGGKIKVGDHKIEVFSRSEYIGKDVEVEIIKIDFNKVYVKPTQTT